MKKLYSQIIGLPVIEELSQSQIDLVRDLLIDPENGKVAAFLLKNNQVIVPFDVERLSHSGLHISEKERIVPMDDVLRVQQVKKMHIAIIGEKVLQEGGKTLLGRVVDYEIDTTLMVLTGIFVAKVFFFFRFQERIISAKNIVKMEKNLILVKGENENKVKEAVRAASQAFA